MFRELKNVVILFELETKIKYNSLDHIKIIYMYLEKINTIKNWS